MTTANSNPLFERRKGDAQTQINRAIEAIFAGEIAMIRDRLGPDFRITNEDEQALREQIKSSLAAAAN